MQLREGAMKLLSSSAGYDRMGKLDSQQTPLARPIAQGPSCLGPEEPVSSRFAAYHHLRRAV